MNRRRMLLAAMGGLVLAVSAGLAVAQQAWILLGTRTVNLLAEQDVVNVTAAAGVFERIGLRARGNDLYVFDVRVVFGNGDVQDVPIRETIPQGDTTRAIDLMGNNRIISSVILTYRRPVGGGAVIIEVYGQR